MRATASVILLLLLATVAMAQTSQSADPTLYLRAKTNWKGREKNTDPTAKKSWPAHVKVMERKGDKITLNFWTVSDDGRKGVQLEGTVDDAGEIKARVTKLLPGDDWHETMVGAFFSGSVKDKTLVINRKSHRGGSLKAELTLQGKDKD
jgi:hypothetical protein